MFKKKKFQKKVSDFGQKKSFHALVGPIGLHSNPGISFMSLAVIKGIIRIANEESLHLLQSSYDGLVYDSDHAIFGASYHGYGLKCLRLH